MCMYEKYVKNKIRELCYKSIGSVKWHCLPEIASRGAMKVGSKCILIVSTIAPTYILYNSNFSDLDT